MCVNQRLDVYHINYKFNYRDSENYGNNIRGIHKLKIFFISLKLLIAENLFSLLTCS